MDVKSNTDKPCLIRGLRHTESVSRSSLIHQGCSWNVLCASSLCPGSNLTLERPAPLARVCHLAPVRRAFQRARQATGWVRVSSMSSLWGRSSWLRLPCVSGTRRPVARLRSLVFDAYQRARPARIRSGFAGAHRRYRRGVAEAGRAMALAAHRACRARRQARRGRRGGDRLRHGVPRARPHVAGQHAALSGRSPTLSRRSAEEVEKLPSNDQVFAEAIGKGPVVLGFIASPQATSLPETKAGFAHGGDDPEAVRPVLPGRRGEPHRAAGQGARRRLAQLDPRARPDHPPHAHAGAASATRSIPLCRPTCSGSRKALRPMW